MKYQMISLLLFSICLQAYNPQQVDTLLQALEQNEEINCSRCDFRGLGDLLADKDLSNMNFAGAMFDVISDSAVPAASLVKNPGQQSDLSGVSFPGCTLTSASFAGAILKEADFSAADIAYVNFSGADLTGVIGLDQAENASLASFAGAIMPDGTKPTGSTWTSKPSKKYPSGKVFYLRNGSASQS